MTSAHLITTAVLDHASAWRSYGRATGDVYAERDGIETFIRTGTPRVTSVDELAEHPAVRPVVALGSALRARHDTHRALVETVRQAHAADVDGPAVRRALDDVVGRLNEPLPGLARRDSLALRARSTAPALAVLGAIDAAGAWLGHRVATNPDPSQHVQLFDIPLVGTPTGLQLAALGAAFLTFNGGTLRDAVQVHRFAEQAVVDRITTLTMTAVGRTGTATGIQDFVPPRAFLRHAGTLSDGAHRRAAEITEVAALLPGHLAAAAARASEPTDAVGQARAAVQRQVADAQRGIDAAALELVTPHVELATSSSPSAPRPALDAIRTR